MLAFNINPLCPRARFGISLFIRILRFLLLFLLPLQPAGVNFILKDEEDGGGFSGLTCVGGLA